ncbi:MAG: GyrI-like domain-containing protein [Labilibaculum sp.]|nr:GyrI-like domain-containing protein [Labilibaculum sp.]
MKKIDLKKKYKPYYSERKGNISIVEVPDFRYLQCEGQGNPNTSEDYKNAIEALFALSYKIKFAIRESKEVDYGVMPLECLWWMDNMEEFSKEKIDEWKWSAMIMQPNFVTKEIVLLAKDELIETKDLPYLANIELIDYTDGLSAQIMHIGSYADEAPSIDKLHKYIADNGFKRSGKHREIYLNDPRRTASENLKTIIRQPIVKL